MKDGYTSAAAKAEAGLLGFFLAESRGLLLASGLAGLAAGLASAAVLFWINRNGTAGTPAATAALIPFLALLGIRLAASLISKLCLVRLGQDAVYRLRLRLAGAVRAAPLLRLESVGPTRLLSAFTENIPQISGFIANLPALGIHAVAIAACLVYLFWIAPMLASLTLALMAAGIASYRFLMARGVSRFLHGRTAEEALLGDFRLLCEGAKEVKLNPPRGRRLVEGVLAGHAAEARGRTGSALSAFAYGDVWGEFLLLAPLGLALYLAPGHAGFSWEAARQYAMTLIFLSGPLTALVVSLPLYGRAAASLRKLAGLEADLGAEALPSGRDAAARLPSGARLELDAAEFRYPGDGFTVGPVSLELRPGEIVFLVGGNGSGKSTLAKMLSGLYPLSAGALRFCGEAVGPDGLEAYRRRFTAVFSDSPVFPELPGGDGPASEDEARRLLARFGLGEKVRIASGAFDEAGLSAGQRKRLALVAALLEDKPVYLFDEWAAEQDPPFRRAFYEEILPELRRRGKLVVAITHDDRYFHLADRVVRMEYGKQSEASDTVPAKETQAWMG